MPTQSSKSDRLLGLRKILLIGLGVLGVGLLAVFWFNRWRSQAPLYQGKTIKVWALQFDAVSPRAREDSAVAFRALGATAVPELTRLLESRDPIWRKALWATSLKLPPRFRFPLVRHARIPEETVVHLSLIHI